MERRTCKKCGENIGFIPRYRQPETLVPVDVKPLIVLRGEKRLGVSEEGEIIWITNESPDNIIYTDMFPAHFKTCTGRHATIH
jgi:hypothetical protein